MTNRIAQAMDRTKAKNQRMLERQRDRRHAAMYGLPDPYQSQWDKNRWKRRWKRVNRKLLGITPLSAFGLGMIPTLWVDDFDGRTLVLGGAILAGLGWKAAAETAYHHRKKGRARLRRRLQRHQREMEKIASQHIPHPRERMSEPPFYTDSPTIVRDTSFKRRNANQL